MLRHSPAQPLGREVRRGREFAVAQRFPQQDTPVLVHRSVDHRTGGASVLGLDVKYPVPVTNVRIETRAHRLLAISRASKGLVAGKDSSEYNLTSLRSNAIIPTHRT